MPNPYNLTDEQTQTYAAQVAEERAARRKRTPADEETRYATEQAWLKQMLDDAAYDTNPAVVLLRAQLYSERYMGNETAHTAYYARHGIIQALQQRIQEASR